MKTINVVAAIIRREDKIFVTQRGYGEFKDYWEFPGGKIEDGESLESALIREIKEELNTLISVDKYLDTIEYDYPSFHLSMKCFMCSIIKGHLDLLEAEDARWVSKDGLDDIDFLPADLLIIDKIKKELS